jgi:hypothetical protein
MPTVGSSRNRICASCTKARAISSRRFMPEESVRTMCPRHSESSTELEHRLDPAAPLRRRDAIDEPVEIEVLVKRQTIVEARLLEHDAEVCARPASGFLNTSMPLMRRCRCRAAGWCREYVPQGGLARAIGAEQREQLARRTSKLTLSSASVRPIALAHAFDLTAGTGAVVKVRYPCTPTAGSRHSIAANRSRVI